MERLTTHICGHAHGAEGLRDDNLTGNYCRGEFEATAIVDRLAAIEDILGDEYDLDRLRVIMDAEQHGGLIVRYPRDDPGPKGPPRCLPRLREIRGDILGRKNRRIYLCFVRLGQYRGCTTEGAGWLIGRS